MKKHKTAKTIGSIIKEMKKNVILVEIPRPVYKSRRRTSLLEKSCYFDQKNFRVKKGNLLEKSCLSVKVK